MKRTIWEQIVGFIPLTSYPTLPCPYCGAEGLSICMDTFSYKLSDCSKTKALMDYEQKKKFDTASEAIKANTFLGVLVGIASVVDAFSNLKTPEKFICFFECRHCNNRVSATGTAQIPTTNAENSHNTRIIKVERKGDGGIKF